MTQLIEVKPEIEAVAVDPKPPAEIVTRRKRQKEQYQGPPAPTFLFDNIFGEDLSIRDYFYA